METLHYILTLSWIPGVAITESYFDAKKGIINHFWSAIVRVLIAGLYSVWLVEGLLGQITYGITCLTIFWIVFDPSYNLWVKRPIWQMGKTAWTDKLANKVVDGDGSLYTMSKFFLLGAVMAIYHYA